MKAWAKGGLIGAAIMIVIALGLIFIATSFMSISNIPGGNNGGTMSTLANLAFSLTFLPSMYISNILGAGIFGGLSVTGIIPVLILYSFVGFIAGAVIGFIVDSFKKKSPEVEVH
jgi:ABC-type multidrug transport system permease subunit